MWLYDEVRDFSEDFASVKLKDKWGFIDKTNQIVLDLIYDNATDFYGDLAYVQYEDKWVYINKQGQIIDSPLLDNWTSFYYGDIRSLWMN